MKRAFAFGLLFLALSCQKDPEETAIRQIVDEMKIAMEAKDFEKALAPVSSDYQDNVGSNRRNLSRRFKQAFQSYDHLAIHSPIEKMERSGWSATVHMQIRVDGIQGSKKEMVFGSPLGGKKVELYFQKRLDRWWITGTTLMK